MANCTSVPMATEAENAAALRFTPKPDKATIYIYRNETIGTLKTLDVSINDIPIGATKGHTFFAVDVPHEIAHTKSSARVKNDSTVNLIVNNGKNYFVWQEVKLGFISARNELHIVDMVTGEKGTERM